MAVEGRVSEADVPAGGHGFADALIETAQCLVCVLNRQGRFVLFNRACEETTGFSREEALGRDARELVIPPEEADEFGVVLATALSERRPAPATGHWLTRGGGRRMIAWANTPLLGSDGNPRYLVATGLDVTEREAAAAEVRRLAEEQSALRRVATLVAADAPPELVLQAVTEEVGKVSGAEYAATTRYEDDGAAATIVGRWDGTELGALPVGATVRLAGGDTAAARVYRTGKPARMDNYEDAEGEAAAAMRALGFASSVAAPITVSGRIWGCVIVATAGDEPLPPETEPRIGDFAELAALAVASTDAREQLEASRARLVEASDAERRRLERNLHDGAQQRLVSLSLAIRLARSKLASDPEGAERVLVAAGEDLEHALSELRELARGLHPAVLSQRGLAAAVQALAQRAPLPVALDVTDERFGGPVEAAAYYVVAEALTNVAKHAGASRAAVSVTCDAGRLVVEVRDDGRGGADLAQGSGLRGLRDRVDAVGGQLELLSVPRSGTTLRAVLPGS